MMGTEGTGGPGQDQQEIEGGGERPRLRSRVGRYVVIAIALAAIIAMVLLVRARLQPEIKRAPIDFLPLSTRAAFAVDARPEGPGARKMREVWAESDVEHLAERGAALTQRVVDWTGLKLDVDSEETDWYGNELVFALVAGSGNPVVSPRSAVVVARATSLRRARAALDRAAQPSARELEWRRAILKRGRDRITVWRGPSGKDEIAYVARDGCLLVARGPEVLEQCLRAADASDERLAETEAFQQGVSQLAAGALVWGYLDVAQVGQGLRAIVPGIWGGWGEALRMYLWDARSGGARAQSAQGQSGTVAVALAPERDGVRLRGRYWRTSPAEGDRSPNRLGELAAALPRDTVGYLLAHEPARWLPFVGDVLLSRAREGDQQGGGSVGLLALAIPWMAAGNLPKDMLAAVVPVGGDGRTGVVVIAPSDQMSVPEGGLGGFVLSRLASARVGDVTLVASDEEALEKCTGALEGSASRLRMEVGPDLRFDVWGRPAAISKRLARFEEVRMKGWESASGGEWSVLLKVSPRALLGKG